MATSLSAGLIIRDALVNSDIKDKVTKIFPVVADSALLPYIVYRCESSGQVATKSGMTGSDTVRVVVDCYAQTYAESVELAEAVRAALDYVQRTKGDIRMRICCMSDSEDSWEDDAFLKRLVFTVKI